MTDKERLEKGEPFADLERVKIDILKDKIQTGLVEFKHNERKQWTELRFEKPLLDKLLSLIEQAEQVQELEEENKRYREILLKIFKVTQNHQIEKISDYTFSRAGMLFYEWIGPSGAIDLDRYCDEVDGHDDYDCYSIERMIDEMIKECK